ncbi:MAG: M56 family metallopeptidase [Gemmatimonadota bacterium]
MIAAWLLCFLVVGGLLLVAAVAADAVCARLGLPRRAVWIVAMFAMLLLPPLLSGISPPLPRLAAQRSIASSPTAPSNQSSGAAIPVAEPANFDAFAPALAMQSAMSPMLQADDESAWSAIGGVALAAWLALSLGCVTLLLMAQRRLHSARRDWTLAPDALARQVQGLTGAPTPLWCSTDVGPAALGVRRPEIVIPHWALELDDTALTLLLTHEASHVTARDPLLLRVAFACLVVMPWNPALLIAYLRLHRAVEHDCDARVLRSTGDARSYGRLLLATAERLAQSVASPSWTRTAPWLPAPIAGIGTRPSELERRLRSLVRPATTWATRMRTAGAMTMVSAALLLACSVPAPERQEGTGDTKSLASGSAFQVISRSGSTDRSTAPTAIDSIAAMEAFMMNVMPRAQVLQDSIVATAARRAEPHVFDGSAPDVEDVWLLLNDDYSVRRSNTGRQHYSVARRDTPGTGAANQVAATPDTPRQQLILGVDAFVRAFPGITPQNVVGMWSSSDLQVGERTVHVLWARYMPTATVSGAPAATQDGGVRTAR